MDAISLWMITVSNSLLLSILVNSNNKENLSKFLDSYETNAKNPKCFEVIVNIDEGDELMINFIKSEINKRTFKLSYIETTGGYFSGHLHNNLMLQASDKSSYFLVCIGDRMHINTKNWDVILLRYVNYFKDDLFRVICSKFKNRNYVDFWECCFAPANIAFTTRKWLEITQNWGPCFSHDAFQQCVSYYLTNSDNFNAEQVKRDVADNVLNIAGQKPSKKNLIDKRIRIKGQLVAWPILTSVRTQKKAKKLAMLILANIINEKNNGIYNISEKKNFIALNEPKMKSKIKLYFNINFLIITISNFYRKFLYLNYAGSGFGLNSFKKTFCLVWYLDYRYEFLKGITDIYCKYFKAKRY